MVQLGKLLPPPPLRTVDRFSALQQMLRSATQTLCLVLACLIGPTSYHKSLPALICALCIMVNSKEGWTVYLLNIVMVTIETNHGLTYSMAIAMEVTAWQSVDAICHCCLTPGSCHWTQISSGYSDGGYQQCVSSWKSWLECFHHSMPSPYDLQRVLDQPVCSMLWIGLTHSSCIVHMCMLYS